MPASPAHPAMFQLLRLQSRGRRRRIWARFCQPRRLVLSAIAAVLAVAWLGNAALTVWLREAGSAESLRAMLSLGLVIYALWHVAKTAFFRPESPFDWTPDERELLAAMPLRPRDLVAYQLASVTVTTLLKAGLFTVLLLPDVRSVPLALVGVLLVMLLLEMLRMATEIGAWGMSRRAFLTYRAVVVVTLAAGGAALGAAIVRSEALTGRINIGQGLRQRFLDILVQWNDSVVGYAGLPFRPFVDLILADRLTASTAILIGVALAMVVGSAMAVTALYTRSVRRVEEREVRGYQGIAARSSTESSLRSEERPLALTGYSPRVQRLPRWGGVGPLLWRQLLGARRYWGSLLTAMIAPAVLAALPVFVVSDALNAFLATMGTLAFYTFLLLPTALRFDFRRDLDRLATLKGLPITPRGAAIGQTLAPVLIATLFQSVVLAFAVAVRDLPLHYLGVAIAVMIPMNVLVFALDNLIFLLYPYRVQQEGLEIFLRTILTFTGKGLLFAAGLGAIATWGFAAAALSRAIAPWSGSAITPYAVFLAGMLVFPSFFATLLLNGLSRTYRGMNPIEDMPR